MKKKATTKATNVYGFKAKVKEIDIARVIREGEEEGAKLLVLTGPVNALVIAKRSWAKGLVGKLLGEPLEGFCFSPEGWGCPMVGVEAGGMFVQSGGGGVNIEAQGWGGFAVDFDMLEEVEKVLGELLAPMVEVKVRKLA